jgi:hypothetical protein
MRLVNTLIGLSFASIIGWALIDHLRQFEVTEALGVALFVGFVLIAAIGGWFLNESKGYI